MTLRHALCMIRICLMRGRGNHESGCRIGLGEEGPYRSHDGGSFHRGQKTNLYPIFFQKYVFYG